MKKMLVTCGARVLTICVLLAYHPVLAAQETRDHRAPRKSETVPAARKSDRAPTSAPAQGVVGEDVSEKVSVSFGGDDEERDIVTGKVQNKTSLTYPCLMLIFDLLEESPGGSLKIVGQDGIMVRGLGPKETRAYRGELKPAEYVKHASTMTCADPKTAGTCNISGRLVADTFSQEYRETPNGPIETDVLRRIFLFDPAKESAKPKEAVLHVDRGGKRRFLFKNVERDRTYRLALDGWWVFDHGQKILVKCTRTDSTQHTTDLHVRFRYEF